jgi:hypothetical protein
MRAFAASFAVMSFALIGCAEAPAESLNAVSPSLDITSHSGTGSNEASYGALYSTAFEAMRSRIDAKLDAPLNVPIPVDAGGGFTHEQHKRNARDMWDAGLLYEATGDAKYSDHLVRLLDAYAAMYSDLPLHPKQKEQTPGRLFWQSLNEAWWLVHAAKGYDKIRADLDEETRERLEDRVFHPVAEFLSEGQPQTFNKIHNHGTWATAAVGLTGYALDRPDYVEKALLGLDLSGEGGFLRQLDVLFSPDGYYNEGPYYQRYALMPFVLFAQAIEENEPERQIFEQRDGILKKAIYTTIQQNYAGLFFPINDAIKDKDIATQELLHGVAIAFELTGDNSVLSIAEAQGRVVPTKSGRAVSTAISNGNSQPFAYRSMRLSDGQNGDQGALDILRESDDPNGLVAVAKNTSQGLGHGHFDKMGLLVFDRGYEILRDYGAARFLNIEAKYGGHYLPENNAYAKQTIAHNALVVDRTSHFDGRTSEGNKHAPSLGAFVTSDALTATSASIDTAYPGVTLTRHVALIRDPALEAPILIDLMSAEGEATHDFDLPFHYNGQLIETNYTVNADTQDRDPLGESNGYQYLWKVGEAELDEALAQTTIILDRRFYTLTSAVPEGTDLILAELGANDPNFNLRREPALILRGKGQSFDVATVFEPHGEYNPTDEFTLASRSQIKQVEHFKGQGAHIVRVELKSGETIDVGLSINPDKSAEHSVEVGDHSVMWAGPYALFPSTQTKTKP